MPHTHSPHRFTGENRPLYGFESGGGSVPAETRHADILQFVEAEKEEVKEKTQSALHVLEKDVTASLGDDRQWQAIRDGNALRVFEQGRHERLRIVTDPKDPSRIIERHMLFADKSSVSTLDVMRKEAPSLSESQYFDLLAKKLHTPELLARFFETFLQYAYDSNDPTNPLKRGTEDSVGEYWQSAGETAQRVENGQMLGDCEDWSLFAMEILKRQGKCPVAVDLGTHLECAWIETRLDGRFDGYTIGTYGLDKNGFGNSGDSRAEEGFASARDVLNALTKKYRTEGQGLAQGVQYEVKGDSIDAAAVGLRRGESLRKKIPLQAFFVPGLADEILGADARARHGEAAEAEATFRSLAARYPAEPLYQERLARLSIRQKKYDEAAVCYVQAVEVEGKGEAEEVSTPVLESLCTYYVSADPERAMDLCEKSLRQVSDPGILRIAEQVYEKAGAQERKVSFYKEQAARIFASVERRGMTTGVERILRALYAGMGKPRELIPVFQLELERSKISLNASRGKDAPSQTQASDRCLRAFLRLGETYIEHDEYAAAENILQAAEKTLGGKEPIRELQRIVQRLSVVQNEQVA